MSGSDGCGRHDNHGDAARWARWVGPGEGWCSERLDCRARREVMTR
jgi:hypothetical protein